MRLKKTLPFILLLVATYTIGFFSGVFHLPPYKQIRYFKRLVSPQGSPCNAMPLYAQPVIYKKRIPCETISNDSLVILAIGQSNAANTGGTPFAPESGVYEIVGNDCFLAQDPLFGASGHLGSIWTRLADRLIKEHDTHSVVLASTAIGGSSVRCWAEGDEYKIHLHKTIRNIQNNGLTIDLVLWQQGESDAWQLSGKAYSQHLGTVIDDLREQGVDAPIFIARTSNHIQPDTEILNAQTEMFNPETNIFLGPETDKITAEYRRNDGHFTNIGLQECARQWLEAIRTQTSNSFFGGKKTNHLFTKEDNSRAK